MRRYALIALAFLATTSAHAQTSAVETFDFKGISLDITLEDIRATRPADRNTVNARAVCTGDPEINAISHFETRTSPEESAAGVVRCAFYNSSRYGGSDTLATLLMAATTRISRHYRFDFFPDPESGQPRLYRIVIFTHIDARAAILDALRDRFGAPTEVTAAPVRNAMGAVFDRTVTRWRRNGATLSVTAPNERFDQMTIVYTLSDLAALADSAVRAQRASIPNRM